MHALSEAKRWTTDALDVVGPGCWVPDVPAHFVRRERLEARLDDAVQSRLTVVAGMAGTGKSVLLAGWASARAVGTTAWLDMEPADTEPPVRFWPRLVRALRVADPDVGDRALAAMSVGASDTRVAEILVGELDVVGPIAVVLDGLHLLTDTGLLHAVVHLAGHLPSHVHLIVTTRQPGGLGLHRLRMSGELVEIGQTELSFRAEEAGRLLSPEPHTSISSDDIEGLVIRTEGWAAGLRLVSACPAERKDGAGSPASVGGYSVHVAEYLQHEVLDGLPPETVQFMMETSVLEVMTAGLWREVTDRADAGALLEDLTNRGLFTFRVNGAGRRYRYHPLFAEFLRGRLGARDPDRYRHAHLRAASWMAGNGHDRDAFDHLVQAHAYDQALALGAADLVGRLTSRGPADGHALLPGRLPRTYLEGDPWRMYLVAAALHYCTGAGHAPHHVPKEWADRYRGKFDAGWDEYRKVVHQRQLDMGIIPAGTKLSADDPDFPRWETLSADQRRLYARMMEVYAGFISFTDYHFGRVVDFLEEIGELDNTLFMLISDNGCSAEGGPVGSVNEMFFFNNVAESLEENLAQLEDLGGPSVFNHYPWGWTNAGNTPFRRWKRETYRGGVSDPFIVSWPRGIAARGEIRTQYAHAIDIVPTVLEALAVDAPRTVRGVHQAPIEGVSNSHTPSMKLTHRRSITRTISRRSVIDPFTTTGGGRSARGRDPTSPKPPRRAGHGVIRSPQKCSRTSRQMIGSSTTSQTTRLRPTTLRPTTAAD